MNWISKTERNAGKQVLRYNYILKCWSNLRLIKRKNASCLAPLILILKGLVAFAVLLRLRHLRCFWGYDNGDQLQGGPRLHSFRLARSSEKRDLSSLLIGWKIDRRSYLRQARMPPKQESNACPGCHKASEAGGGNGASTSISIYSGCWLSHWVRAGRTTSALKRALVRGQRRPGTLQSVF